MIDIVYVGLPNGLHFEWAMKGLAAGKHVLLEKPSTSNASETRRLFRRHLMDGQIPTIMLEAVHIRFHPAWQKFLSLLDPPIIAEAISTHNLPSGALSLDDIRYRYDLSGGCLMDFGSYNIQMLRQVFGAPPKDCVAAQARFLPAGLDQNIDQAFSATWNFPNGGTGSIVADMATTGGHYFPYLTSSLPRFKTPMCSVRHREKIVPHPTRDDMEISTTRTVIMWNQLFASIWHRIDIIEDSKLLCRSNGRIEKSWRNKSYIKQYTGDCGDDSWTTYRHQLEQFVNKIRGRPTSVWIDGGDSIEQMETIDDAYKKAGISLRPSSAYEG